MPFLKRRKKEKTKEKKKPNNREGQLAVDVYENEREIIVIAPISNAKEESLDVYIEKNAVTISGTREVPEEESDVENFLHQECYWGKFSREIILPEEVDSYLSTASFKNGIIRVKLPKMKATQRKRIRVNEVKEE